MSSQHISPATARITPSQAFLEETLRVRSEQMPLDPLADAPRPAGCHRSAAGSLFTWSWCYNFARGTQAKSPARRQEKRRSPDLPAWRIPLRSPCHDREGVCSPCLANPARSRQHCHCGPAGVGGRSPVATVRPPAPIAARSDKARVTDRQLVPRGTRSRIRPTS